MAQEVRPIGADLQWSPSFYVTVGGTAFRGNDTMGTLLAGRGWTLGNYLAVVQREPADAGAGELTRPFGEDLDGRNGYAERIRVSLPERAMLQVTHIDNRATISPVRGQRSGAVADAIQHRQRRSRLDAPIPRSPANWMRGSTEVGFPGGSFTMDFDTAYLLGSHKFGHERISGRVERFSTRNARHVAPDFARETRPRLDRGLDARGECAFASRHRILPRHRRPPGVATFFSPDFDPRTGGSTITLEYRYSF